jgi:cyclic beta-1,2-glucan synthetase
VAADIYSTPPHIGHGGWTWYTGSSGWLYRLGTEAILGFQLHGDHLIINPCIPQDWDEYEMTYWHEDTQIEIRVKNPEHVSVGVREVMINGQKQEEHQIPLNGQKELIEVDIIMGSA